METTNTRARAAARPARRAPAPRPEATPRDERCLVVLPTYDEAENLRTMVRAIGQHLDCSILVVDDASPDGTGRIADELAESDPRLSVLHRAGKQGLGTAYVAGFRWALERGFDRVLEMDCDFSHPPRSLPDLVDATREAHLAVGSRYVSGGATSGWPLRRRLLSRGANLYARAFLGAAVRDWTAGFRCYRADVLERIDLGRVRASGYSFQIQMTHDVLRAGGRVVEVPIVFVDREEGRSKMSAAIAWEAVRLVPRLGLDRLLRR